MSQIVRLAIPQLCDILQTLACITLPATMFCNAVIPFIINAIYEFVHVWLINGGIFMYLSAMIKKCIKQTYCAEYEKSWG